MDWHMAEVLPGLYVGNYRDSKDQQQLEKFQITHIIAIHDSPRRLLHDKHYLCVMAADTPDQNLSQYFSVCNDFIHAARLREGNVLIHCLAGMSRSVTVAVAYIMTATNLNWKEALKVVRTGRAVANPNVGFQTQLQEFEMYRLTDERRRLRERYPSTALEQLDRSKCTAALDNYQELLQNKDICEGNCSRGEKCPTGVMFNVRIKSNNEVEANITSSDNIPSSSCANETTDNRSDISHQTIITEDTQSNGSASDSISYMLSFAAEQWKTKPRKRNRKIANTQNQNENPAEQLIDYYAGGEELIPNVIYFKPFLQNESENDELVEKS